MKARRGWAWPLVPLYWAGLRGKDGLRALGVLRTRQLEWPVVSVGSLSAGGAGKTPVVIALAELLRDRGWAVDVLSRGYGREATDVERVDLGVADAARRFGDEPVLIAERTGVGVWVGAERYEAGRAAEAHAMHSGEVQESRPQRLKPPFNDDSGGTAEAVPLSRTVGRRWQGEAGPSTASGAKAAPNSAQDENLTENPGLEAGVPRVHLLDDGFQHRRLARAMDVVVVTAEDLEDALLPAGNLREPLAAVRRADAVVVREEERESIEKLVREKMRPDAVLWSAHRRLRLPDALAEKVFLFCAIARPDGLWAMLAQAGCNVVGKIAFPDHYAYRVGDVDRLVEEARRCGATGFLTTEKDGVKLSQAMMVRLLEVGAVGILKLDVTFVDEAEARIR